MSMIEHALRYADAGWPVFPVAGVRDPIVGGCTCGSPNCGNAGKHPLTGRGGFHVATTDPVQVAQWWQRHPDANIGLRTGGRLFVVDIDGQAGLEDWQAMAPSGLATLTCRTGGGGLHLYFAMPDGLGKLPNRKLGKAKSIDIRAGAGYVILPPSLHKCGREYTWADTTASLLALPDWLLRAVEQRTHITPHRPPAQAPGKSSKYGEAVLSNALDRIARAPQGDRNNSLAREAFVIGQYVAGGEIDPPGVLEALIAACPDPDRTKTHTTAMRQLREGLLYPRKRDEAPAARCIRT